MNQTNTTAATVPRLMRAAALHAFGGVEQLRLLELPVPTVGADDVLIRVEAAGLGSWDAQEREGLYDGLLGFDSGFPYVLGWDGAGTIAAVGERVRRFRAGDRVCAASMPLPRGGFYAEFAVVHQEHVAPVPAGLTVEQAAALPWDALTALSGLDALGLAAGQPLLVFGASGGIGHMAVQFARHAGARVLAVASGDDGVALARRLGAQSAMDGRREDPVRALRDFAPAGVRAALVTAGGETVDRTLAALPEGARIAFPRGVFPEPRAEQGRELIAYDGDRGAAAMGRLVRRVEEAGLQVHLAGTFDLADVQQAHRALEAHYVGKMALRVAFR